MTDQPTLPHIDLEEETQMLHNKLTNPVLGVAVVQYSEASGIDANEIARRGTKRPKPANSNGEELRDVILWLLVFQYARTTGREIALISGDHGFRKSKNEDVLDPDLQAEIVSEHLPIHFHREISSFVTSQSLSHDEIDESWVTRYISNQDLNESILNALSESYVPSFGVPTDSKIDVLRFVNGTQYRISKDSVYGEVRYRVEANLTFNSLSMPWNSLKFLNAIPGQDFGIRYGALLHSTPLTDDERDSKLVSSLSPAITAFTPAASGMVYSPTVAAGILYSPTISGGLAYSPNVAAGIAYSPHQHVEKKLRFDVSLSLRIESEKLLSWQVDEVELSKGSE